MQCRVVSKGGNGGMETRTQGSPLARQRNLNCGNCCGGPSSTIYSECRCLGFACRWVQGPQERAQMAEAFLMSFPAFLLVRTQRRQKTH